MKILLYIIILSQFFLLIACSPLDAKKNSIEQNLQNNNSTKISHDILPHNQLSPIHAKAEDDMGRVSNAIVDFGASSTHDGMFLPEMIDIISGEFVMGGAKKNEYMRETPLHTVTVKSFRMSKYEVTNREYKRFKQYQRRLLHADNNSGDLLPATHISWLDTQAYIQWLNEGTGRKFRLPTESEWEYAARAGHSERYFFGNNVVKLCLYANAKPLSLDSVSRKKSCRDPYIKTAPIGQFKPNSFGLYDMYGNVWEWTADCWHVNYQGAPSDTKAWLGGDCSRRVIRGGAWNSPPWLMRSAYRGRESIRVRDAAQGFRLAEDLD